MPTPQHSPLLCSLLSLGLLGLGCSDDTTAIDSDSSEDTNSSSETDESDSSETSDTDDSEGDGDGDPTDSGDGDGDDIPACSFVWEATQMKLNGQVHAGFDLAVAPDGSLIATGRIEQEQEQDYELWIGKFDPAGEPLWEQTLAAAGNDYGNGVAVDEAGEVYVVGSLGEGFADNIWVSKRSGSDGSELWAVTRSSEFDGDNLPGGIAFGPEGRLFVSGTVRAGDDDTDIWIGEYSTQDGSLSWSGSFSGQTDPNGFSIDRAGSLSITPQGQAYVGGTEGVNFETREGVLVAFDTKGSSDALWRFAPQANGEAHEHSNSAVLAGPDEEAYVVLRQTSGEWAFWLYRVDASGQIEWELSEQDFVYGTTDNWDVNGLELRENGQISIGGTLIEEEVGQAISWSEVWVANLTRDGQGQCIESHTWQNENIIPASTFGYGFAEGPGGTAVIGEIRNGPTNYLWVGGYK